MQRSLVILLLGVLALAGLALATAFRRATGSPGRAHAQAALIGLLAIVAPLLVVTLRRQGAATDELRRLGLETHPAVGEPVGMPTGDPGSRRSWVFGFHGTQEALARFYSRPEHRAGWTVEDSSPMLLMRRGQERLTLTVAERWTDTTLLVLFDRETQRRP